MAFCVEEGVCEGKGERERQKEDFHCFDQIAGEKKLQLLRFLYLQSYVAKCKIKFKKTKNIFCRWFLCYLCRFLPPSQYNEDEWTFVCGTGNKKDISFQRHWTGCTAGITLVD